MKCEKCQADIQDGEERDHFGQVLCEDCYIDILSPAKPCDPWAVHSAKSMGDTEYGVTHRQQKILDALKGTQGLEPEDLAHRVGLSMDDLQREIATLRHMEKIRAAMAGDKKVICRW